MSKARAGNSFEKFVRLYLSASLALICETAAAGSSGEILVEGGISAYRAGEYQKAMTLLEPAAQNGDVEALYLLGTLYEAGLGVRADDSKAERLYSKAAAKGHPEAQFALGIMHLTVDNEIAESWLEKALSNHHPNARYVLDSLHSGKYDDAC